MSFLGLEIEKAPPGYRAKRFAAFVIDVLIMFFIWFAVYSMTGKPDYYSVQLAMDAVKGAAGADAQALTHTMLSRFNEAYGFSLMLWFAYESITQLLFSGATIGKKVMKLRVVPLNPNRKPIVHYLLLIARSAIKMLSLYLFQGFPFAICQLTIFSNKEGRSGMDMFVKTRVECCIKGEKQ
ncbi:RDD family protein [Oscillospiraceae bacterium PP1C4]